MDVDAGKDSMDEALDALPELHSCHHDPTVHTFTDTPSIGQASMLVQRNLPAGVNAFTSSSRYSVTGHLEQISCAASSAASVVVTDTGILTSNHSDLIHSNPSSSAMDVVHNYVIVEEPMDINNFGDFSGGQTSPCTSSSLVLPDDMPAESHIDILNTPKAVDIDPIEKAHNHFSTMDLLAVDDDMSEHDSQSFRETSELRDTTVTNESFDYAYEGIASKRSEIASTHVFAEGYNMDAMPIKEANEPISITVTTEPNQSTFEKTDGTVVLFENNKQPSKQLEDIAIVSDMDTQEMSELLQNGAEKTVDSNSDVGYLLHENSEEENLRSFDITSEEEQEADTNDTIVDQDRELSIKRQEEEKNTFSENLGLIPADTESKIIAQRSMAATTGVRTRKSLVVRKTNTASSRPPIVMSTSPIQGHSHRTSNYRCGACGKVFAMMCKLHDHLEDSCHGGSYHYDHILRTAFPKFDTSCSYTQTNVKDLESNPPSMQKGKPRKLSAGAQLKSLPTVTKKDTQKRAKKEQTKHVSNTETERRKRGRPRKYIEVKPLHPAIAETGESADTVIDADIDNSFDHGFPDLDSIPFDTDADTPIVIETDEALENVIVNCDTSNAKQTPESDVASSAGTDSPRKRGKRKMNIPRKVVNKSIPCEFCSNMFTSSQGLIRHEQEKHADQMTYECDECEQRFMRAYNLERHKLCAHSNNKAAASSKAIYKMKKRAGRKPVVKSAEDTSTVCSFCNQNVPSSKLDIHVRLHTGERPFICHVCGKGLISEKKLKRHLLIHSEMTKHTCEVCGLGFTMKYKLRTHMYIHTGHKPYLCSVCGAEFNNSTSLLHHHRTVHLGDKRFECKICGGRYGKRSQLDEHMFSHSKERTQTCKFCGKSFKHAKSLRRHELTHVSDTKFACDQCDSKFSRKDNLERHKMCHVQVALFCSFCKKKFRDRTRLIEHEQYHVTSRKFQCQVCKEKYQDEEYFYSHMEKNHDITKDMVPIINALANDNAADTKPTKTKRVKVEKPAGNSGQVLKIPTVPSMHSTSTSTSVIDTLNLSMSVAGILPTSTIDINAARIIQEAQFQENFDVQRLALVGQLENNDTVRMSHDQTVVPIALTATGDAVSLQEQHRRMQEAISSAGLQITPGYRLQDVYNEI